MHSVSSKDIHKAMHSVSSKDIHKARRIARRTRSAVACARCKASKVKCNDYRPCKQCTDKLFPCHEIDMQGSMLGSSKKMKSENKNHVSRPLTSNLQSRSEECIGTLGNANRISFPGQAGRRDSRYASVSHEPAASRSRPAGQRGEHPGPQPARGSRRATRAEHHAR